MRLIWVLSSPGGIDRSAGPAMDGVCKDVVPAWSFTVVKTTVSTIAHSYGGTQIIGKNAATSSARRDISQLEPSTRSSRVREALASCVLTWMLSYQVCRRSDGNPSLHSRPANGEVQTWSLAQPRRQNAWNRCGEKLAKRMMTTDRLVSGWYAARAPYSRGSPRQTLPNLVHCCVSLLALDTA